MVDIEDFHIEVYDHVSSKVPFYLFNKYYVIATGDKQLYGYKHMWWINYLLDRYSLYKKDPQNSTWDREGKSLKDGLELLLDSDENHRLFF